MTLHRRWAAPPEGGGYERVVATGANAPGRFVGRAFLGALAAAVIALLALQTVVGLPAAALAFLAPVAVAAGSRRPSSRRQPLRTLLVGSASSLRELEEELAFHRVRRYALVGCLSPDPRARDAANDASLGTLADLRAAVLRHDVDLVLMTSKISRMAVFDAMARDCSDLDVRLSDLSEFYEDTFGYTPIAEINSAWFHAMLHPRYRAASLTLKRVFDLVFVLVVGAVLLPVLGVLAWLIRRDGGPALFRQVRIGEGGRPFTLYKLRTMVPLAEEEASWSTAEDPRVTPLGRHLRRWHVDELPQLWNILRGEMSVVGPRPEQPHFVTRLEREFAFYHRRHVLRPGLAGWAQARCGYAGSDSGSAWKLSHDLYYLKRRSLLFDVRILLQSLWQVVAADQFAEPRLTPVVVRIMGDGVSQTPMEESTELDLGVGRCA